MSSSRRMSKQREDGEFFLECKAAFLSIYDDIDDRIESKKSLNTLLQTTGRNPTRTALSKYWPHDTVEMSFNDFVDICKKEPVTSADDLMKAFRKIDINGDGYISLDELYKIMNAQGENMSRDEVRKMIDEVDENKDGKLDYSEFTNMVMKTSEESKQFSVKVMERKEKKKRRIERARNSGNKEVETEKPDRNLGSKASLRSEKHEVEADYISVLSKDVRGSRVSLRSQQGSINVSKVDIRDDVEENVHGSTASLKPNSGDINSIEDDVKGSKLSLRSGRDTKGSKVSLRAEGEDVKGSKISVRGSKTSLKAESQNIGSSRVSLRKETEDVKGSKASLKVDPDDVNGSKVSLRGNKEDVKVSKASLRGDLHDSKVSLRSESGRKQAKANGDSEDITSDKYYEDDEPKLTSADGGSTQEKPKEKSPEPSPKKETHSRTDGVSSVEISKQKCAGKRVQSAQKGLPPKPEQNKPRELNVSNKQSNSLRPQSTKCSMGAAKLNPANHSARTVGEELDYDDDCDIVSTGRPTPRIDLNSARKDSAKADVKPTPREEIKSKSARKEDKDDEVIGSKTSLRSDGDVLGSRISMRSASGDTGAPVPSPRKTLSARLSEDEVPRPSPRVTLKRDSKGKSSSSSKFPDPKSLRDWTKFSSKGCFFYEEDEIVSHVFSLRLRDDSTVFLSAKPIQEPQCLSLSSAEPVDTALYIFDKDGRLVTFTELRDVEGKFGVKLELRAGEYQVLPYTTGCRFKQRQADQQQHVKEAKLVKKGKDDNIVITSAFRRALEDIFDLCDLDNNGTMSYDEFNWFNLRTSGEELEEEEWKVVEERTTLENGEITKQGFIELNEMEAEDVKGDTEDLWITLTSMGMNKALIMDEACPYRVEIYIEETGNKKSSFKVTGIESLDKKEFVDEICRYVLEKGEPSKIRSMKDLYSCTYKNDYWANVVIDNRSRSTVSLEVDCSKSRNVESNRSGLDYTFEVDPQSTAIAHYLMPRSETNDWSVHSEETIHK